jgi:hypothetical protein
MLKQVTQLKAGFIVATAAAAVLLMPQVSHAFLITRTSGPVPGTGAPLAPPTVIDFNSFANNTPVPAAATLIATGAGNGNAFIQRTLGLAEYQGNQLNIGVSGSGSTQSFADAIVSFTFNAPRGLGYFGLQWQNPQADESIRFYSGSTLIQTLTGTQVLANAIGAGGNYFNFIVTNNGEIFNRVDLARLNPSNGNFFRVDDVAYQQIPTPVLLPGLLGLGFGILKKKRKQEAMAAV